MNATEGNNSYKEEDNHIIIDRSTKSSEMFKNETRKILSDILNSSDDSFTVPPLHERLKTTSTPYSTTCLKEPNFNNLTSSDESDKEFNILLNTIKTPLKKCKTSTSISDFNENINLKKFSTVEQKLRSLRISSPKKHITPIVYNPITLPTKQKVLKNISPLIVRTELFQTKESNNKNNSINLDKKKKNVKNKSPQISSPEEKYSFLESLSSSVPLSDIHKAALPYRTNFKERKEELIKVLYKIYNETVFNNKLPSDLTIIWNVRMRKTAGFCCYYMMMKKRYAKIELSTKVLDSADRVRDTLIHELCHAASWIIQGYRDGHGSIWNYWAKRANNLFPELPKISRCHHYDIITKFVYKCTRCGGCIGRHSKSLDVKRKLCGWCGGTFELMVNGNSGYMISRSKPISRFAHFVKENYNTVKENHKEIKHAEIMKKLSIQFNSTKLNNI